MKRKCLNALCKICGHHALLPGPFQIPLCFDESNGYPLYSGGYADVWMGKHQGCDVAVKVLRVYSASDLDKITSVSHRPRLARGAHRRADDRCDRTDILQGSCHMEDSPPPERAPAIGGDDGGGALCNGFGLDGQWEHQRVHQGTQGYKPVRARRVLFPPLAHLSLMKSFLAARRHDSGVAIYSWRGDDSWGSEGGTNSSADSYSTT